jgi:tetratricopeptide (TPR) repeat protein
MDAQIKRVLDCLDSRQRDKTLIVVVGDHGESLGEHRERDHGAFIYNATTHVPLILNLPGRLPEGETQSELAGLVDVAATILDVLNWPQPDGMGGQSLLGTDDTEQGIYGESEWLMNSYGWAPLYSLTTSRWKYIDAPEPELYDCVADPRELKNLTAIENAVAVEMSARLEALRAGMQTRQAETLILDAEQIARLRSLGYLGGSGAQIETGQRQDPKRMMDVFNGGQKANELQALSRHREAIALLLPLIEQSPASLELRKTIVTSYVELDELIAAKPHAEAYLRQEPQNRIIIGCVAGAFVQLGDLAQATSLYRDALRVPARPDESVGSGVTATLHRSLGQVLEMQKQLPAAAEQYEIYLNLAPDDTLIRGGLASLYGKLGVQAVDDPDAAIRYYREALELRPELTAASSNLGFVLWQEKRYGEALAVWRQGQVTYFLAFSLATCPAAKYRDGAEALRLATALCDRTQYGNARFLDALAAAHAETGRYAEAAEVARRAVEIADGVGNAGQAREIGARLQLYEAGKPFRTKTAVRRER